MMKPHPFNSDHPISVRAEDRLGRNGFAKSLAESIRAWKARESLVIGLFGEWGQGKTSVKNLILDFLKEKDSDAPFIVEFNPWQWSSQSQIAEAFFDAISTTLGRDTAEGAKQRAKKWRQYAALLNFGEKATDGLRQAVLDVLLAIAIAGGATGLLDKPIVRYIAVGFAVLVLFFRLGSRIAEAVSERWHIGVEDPETVRSKLKDLMVGLTRPVLVVMDDIDRLSVDEIRLVFQLVKSNADFPNMVYLLLFQRDIVESALEKDVGGKIPFRGRDYLEKIINVGFDLPLVEKAKLRCFFSAGVDKLFEDCPLNQEERGRLTDVYHKSLQYFLLDLRDAKRLLSSLDFHLNLLKAGKTLEVNPVDLIALEVLRVFEPGVYASLYGAAEYLTASHGLINDDEKKAAVASIIAKSSSENRYEHVRTLLKTVFPWMESSHINWDDWTNDWSRNLNACHPDIFNRYFLLRLAEGDISQADIQRFLSLTGDRAGLVAELRSVNRQGLFSVFLDRIHVYKHTIDIQHAVAFITAFYDVWDEFDDENGYGLPQVNSIIYHYLSQESDSKKRGEILVTATGQTTGLLLPVMQAGVELARHTGKNTDPCLTDEASFETIKQICLEKLQNAARDGRLLANRDLLRLLHAWQDFGAALEPADWLARQITTTSGLLAVITAFIFRSVSNVSGSYTSRMNWHFNLQTLEAFIPADLVEQQTATLDETTLTDEQRRAVKCFRRELQRKRNGQPYGAGRICPGEEEN